MTPDDRDVRCPYCESTETHGQVYGHYVQEVHRGQGIGHALLEGAESWFREHEMPFWRIDALHGVDEEAVYESFGMRSMEVAYEKDLR